MDPGPNRLLAAARASANLTQEQLAEAANLQVEAITGRPGGMDADYISKLERGVHTWPNKHYRQALRTALGVARDADLGFYSSRTPRVILDPVAPPTAEGTDEDVNRLAFLQALAATIAGAAAGDPIAEAMGRAAKGTVPARAGATEVAQLNQAIDVFGGWQDLYGGGVCREAIAGHVAWATQLLGAEASDGTRAELHRVVGFLVDVAGWGAFDAGYHDDARSYFRLALHCAEQGDDWGLRANVLSDMARQAIYLGRPDDGLSLIELAQVRQDRQTPTVRAMLSTVRARALAKLNRPQDCQAAVRTAEDHFTDSDPANDPGWITYFDEADLYGDTGHALLGVALDGHYVTDTRDRLHRAITGYPDNQARSRAFALGKLAILELAQGDPTSGVRYAGQALAADATLHSARAVADLKALDTALSLRCTIPGAQDVRHQIQQTVRV
ncbi:MAG TPA: XRE family transcriptional regulator [Pseudonocardiaceae bacterium]